MNTSHPFPRPDNARHGWPPVIMAYLNNGIITKGTRDQMAFEFGRAVAYWVKDPREWPGLAIRFADRMEQPFGDEYPASRVLEKTSRAAAYQAGRRAGKIPFSAAAPRQGGKHLPLGKVALAIAGAVEADADKWKVLSWSLPDTSAGRPERIGDCWEAKIPVLPVGARTKDSFPKWGHLKWMEPTPQDWQRWEGTRRFRLGNTALILGFGFTEAQRAHAEQDCAKAGVPFVPPREMRSPLYDVEVESWEEFEKHPDFTFFMTNTVVVKSQKSAHIYFTSDKLIPSTSSRDEQGNRDGRLEFRGQGNLAIAPGSIHPKDTPENPVVYTWVNRDRGTILFLEDPVAFVRKRFPGLFREQPLAAPVQEDEADPNKASRNIMRLRQGHQYEEVITAAGREWPNMPSIATNPEYFVYPEPYKVFGILHPAPSLRLSPGRVGDLLANFLPPDLERGEEHQKAKRCRNCGSPMKGVCPVHGEMCLTRSMCYGKWCTCPTPVTKRIQSLLVDDLHGEEAHRVLRFAKYMPTTAEEPEDLTVDLKNEVVDWRLHVNRLREQKEWKGKVEARSEAFYMGVGFTVLEYTAVVHETTRAEGDAFRDSLLSSRLDIRLVGDAQIQSGETFIQQLSEMSYCNLLGVAEGPDEAERFRVYYDLSNGSHTFQTYGELRQKIIAAKPEPAALCPIPLCGRKLSWLAAAQDSWRKSAPPRAPPPDPWF